LLVEEITEILGRLQWDGATMLLIEQDYQLSFCLDDNEWAYVLEKGKVKSSGTPAKSHARQAHVVQSLGVKL
jgi:ABC-type branched-subunit amino acid transport system ATPase component